MEQTVRDEVFAASQQWIANFNRGDVDACVGAYTADAVIKAKPLGTFQGTQAIDDFWRPFMKSEPGELVYRNVKLEVIDEQTAVLSADWSMAVGCGVITKEQWVKQTDGRWLLEEDHFEIQQQSQP